MSGLSHMQARALEESGHSVWKMAERWLRVAVEIPAAILALVEILILSASVFYRFVLDSPLVWADELAGILFLWLAMLGAVIALQRGQHMRMTAIVNRVPPRVAAFLEGFALAATSLFLLLMIPPSWSYANNQAPILSPALGLSDMIRTSAIPVAAMLMLLQAVIRLGRGSLRALGLAVVLLGAIAALLWAGQSLIIGIGNWNLVLFFVGLLGLGVLAGVPVGFSFGMATISFLLTTNAAPPSVMLSTMDQGMSSLILLAVPLFVFLGGLLEMSGMARAMIAFLTAILGSVRGGLSYVLLGAIYLVSGISGAKAADMAAVAPVLFPEMKKRGMNEGEMVSVLASAAAMSETVPPSIVLIAIGSATGVSIAALFAGGLIPALVLALALGVIAWWRSGGDKPEMAEKIPNKEKLRRFWVALPALALPFVIRFAVVDGVATATEVSTIGIAYAVLVGIFVYRSFDWRRIYPLLIETASLSGAILFIIGAASAMGWALTQSGFSQSLTTAMQAVPGGRVGFMVVSILAFLVLGSVLEGIPAVVLFGPLLFPVAQSIGVNEVHYAITIVLAMGLGLFSPPFGVGYYAACAIGKINPDAGLRRIWPYMGALLVGIVIVAMVPWLTTCLIGAN
ncbi:TRAP transporter large permease [Acidocella facilis]|uniref:TRAP transporter large permease n=1 Tax=Acidocella facilis TaxID=525 RepID=UPI001F2A8ADD|nr:TRAP transporter large permease subunit [Acidocella facilis]